MSNWVADICHELKYLWKCDDNTSKNFASIALDWMSANQESYAITHTYIKKDDCCSGGYALDDKIETHIAGSYSISTTTKGCYLTSSCGNGMVIKADTYTEACMYAFAFALYGVDLSYPMSDDTVYDIDTIRRAFIDIDELGLPVGLLTRAEDWKRGNDQSRSE